MSTDQQSAIPDFIADDDDEENLIECAVAGCQDRYHPQNKPKHYAHECEGLEGSREVSYE